MNKQLAKLAPLDSNHNAVVFTSKRTVLKRAKAQKLKQLQIDLKNEEAKLILLKRLYYSQRIATQPGLVLSATQQQQQIL